MTWFEFAVLWCALAVCFTVFVVGGLMGLKWMMGVGVLGLLLGTAVTTWRHGGGPTR